MTMKSMVSIMASAVAVSLSAADSQVSGIQMDGTAGNIVSVSYRLTGAPAVVTFAVETNAGENVWVKVPDSATTRAWGDVARLVEPDDSADKTFWWRPDVCWPGVKITDSSVRVRVNAWPTNNPPDYMACDLGLTNFVRYYVSAEGVPGGVTNDIYKTDRLLMRRIHATGVEWRMGRGIKEQKTPFDPSMNGYTLPCNVVLSKDYYIGVFEMTQRQFYLFTTTKPSAFSKANGYADGDMRPVESMGVDNYSTVTGYLPNLKAITGVDFRLPSEAQWEFACRAGSTEAFYNGGDVLSAADAIAWHKDNSAVDGTQQTHVVGTREPNAFGLYDMIGNVWEVCRDWWLERPFGTADQVDPEVTQVQSHHVRKGGGWYATHSQWCNSSGRYECSTPSSWWGGANSVGFRLSCDAIAVK